ncbi:Uncharacterized protein FKW44_008733 [Caligus rogercresseyi]|uniref:Uncharacterized protein n=1 Tax=Caligus rogercresseyi TaxID=217165 RepID=A0A7T8QUH4_CALRO|nr:Uncharacterized protein FKW44_008733 [Caligus rogercresseyi]
MAKTLPSLKLAELKDACVRMEIVEIVEELDGKRKAEVAGLIKDYLVACGSDPHTLVFARDPGEGGSQKQATQRGHNSTSAI